MTKAELHWVAGLLEGEGCFRWTSTGPRCGYRYRHVEVNMTDEDVIRKLHKIVGLGRVYGPYNPTKNPRHTPIYRWAVAKDVEAVQVMRLVYPLMCSRRKAKIRELLREVPGVRSSIG